MVFIYTGDGKGKTTAAIGQAIRMIGYGKKVLIVQFIKSDVWPSGEEKTAHYLEPFFKIKKFGLGFVTSDSNVEEHKKAAEKGWEYAKKQIKSGKWGLVILDEINVAVSLKLLRVEDIIEFFKNYKGKSLVILTGRGAPKSFIKIADLVTEMKEIKHQYKKGVVAKDGIEY